MNSYINLSVNKYLSLNTGLNRPLLISNILQPLEIKLRAKAHKQTYTYYFTFR